MKSITSIQNPLVKTAASLHLKKHRDETGMFLVEGEQMIALAIGEGWEIDTLFLGEGEEAFPELDSKIIFVTAEILEKISKRENPQRAVAILRQRHEPDLPSQIEQAILPVLEEIRDPGNLGTIMRSCHALGLRQIVLLGPCCDPFAPETVRASMGSFAAITTIKVTLDNFVQWAQDHPELALIGTDVLRAADYRKVDYHQSALLMGNEQRGLSPFLKSLCNTNVKIPMPGGTESLNVAIATTLLLYEALRPEL